MEPEGSLTPDRPRSNGKPEAATAVDKLLIMGMRMPETCCAVSKRQAIKLRDRCIWLVDLFEYTEEVCSTQQVARNDARTATGTFEMKGKRKHKTA